MGSCSIDDFDGGSKAAIAGGTTSWIDFVVPGRNESMLDAYTRWRGWGDGNVNCDWALHSTVTHWNEQLPGEMKRMIEKGVSSFKFFMAYKGLINLEDSNMYKAMEIAR
jgi:dihydropyrimidinase